MANISPWQLLIVLLIVLLIFGTKKLRNIGGDLGGAVKDFRKGLSEGESGEESKTESTAADDDSSDSTRH